MRVGNRETVRKDRMRPRSGNSLGYPSSLDVEGATAVTLAIGKRTREALRHKRSNGARVGNIEFGFRLSADLRHLEPDPAEQAALAEIRNLRRQGHTLRGIAATLNSRGHRTRRGTDWRLESVARVIKQNALPPH